MNRERAGCTTCIYLNAGDLVQGTPVSTLFHGLPIYEIANQLGIDAAVVGNLDASLAKWFPVRGGIKAEFRVDAFNVTNRAQFSNPNGEFGNTRFGQITETIAGTDQMIRFGLRVLF